MQAQPQAPPIRVHVRIPGKPFAQPRPRAFVNPRTGRASIHPAPAEATWRKYAQDHLLAALDQGGLRPPAFPDGPLELTVRAVFACPRGRHLKRSVRPAEWRDRMPDASNILKAVEDAANGLLWTDDRQIAVARIEKVTAEQGAPPVTVLEVGLLDPHGPAFVDAADAIMGARP
jgi:Holliday junction resolvase RusA-like endonuclease